jgi:hypothetical protein
VPISTANSLNVGGNHINLAPSATPASHAPDHWPCSKRPIAAQVPCGKPCASKSQLASARVVRVTDKGPGHSLKQVLPPFAGIMKSFLAPLLLKVFGWLITAAMADAVIAMAFVPD